MSVRIRMCRALVQSPVPLTAAFALTYSIFKFIDGN